MALVSTDAALRAVSAGESRFTTMNLVSAGPCKLSNDTTSRGRTVRRLGTRDHHTTLDIDGAQPFNRISTITNKPDLHNVGDIEGTSSMVLHKTTNKKDRTLYHGDIEGSMPRGRVFYRTERHINPLIPEYKLPSYTVAPTEAPPFVRDSFQVSDIEGTRPRPLYRFAQRENHSVDDIEGAKAGWKPRHAIARREAPPHDSMLNVRDITGGGFRSQRVTNPLAPSYTVNGLRVEDDPVKSRPRALPGAKNCPYFTLTTADIEGAQCGWRPPPKMNPPMEARRHFRNTNFVGDIPGAQADTVQHSIRSSRHVNPLNPVYTGLDGTAIANPQTPLYREPSGKEAEADGYRTGAAAHPGNQDQLAEASQAPELGNQDADARSTAAMIPPPSGPRSTSAPSTRAGMPGDRDGRSASDVERAPPRSQGSSRGALAAGGGAGMDKDEETHRLIAELDRQLRSLRAQLGQAVGSRSSSSAFRTAAAAVVNPPCSSGGGAGLNGRGDSSGGAGGGGGSGSGSRGVGGGSLGALSSHAGNSSGSGRPAAERLTRSGAGDGGGGSAKPRAALMIRSRGESGPGLATERLVLRSSGGEPRVALTPAERRSAREYTDDVQSVRDLL